MGLTSKQYAAHRKKRGLPGKTYQAVLKAAQSGRITANDDGTFDPKRCDREWKENTKPRHERPLPKKKKSTTKKTNKKQPKSSIQKSLESLEKKVKGNGLDNLKTLIDEYKEIIGLLNDEGLTKTDAEKLKECFLSLKRKLEYEAQAGKLVEVEPLRKRVFEIFRNERDALQNFPTRYGAQIASELNVDQNTVIIILEKFINLHLQERTEEPRL